MNRSASLSLFALPFVLAACAADGDTDTVELEEAEQASTAVETTAEVSYVTTLVVADAAALASVQVEAAVAEIAAQIEANLADGLTVPACATVTTDELTFIEVVFDACTGPHGLAGLSGTVRAELEFDTVPCGRFECVDGVGYSLETSGLTLNGTTFAGAWELHDPLAAGEPYTWAGSLEIDGTRQSIDAATMATIAVSEGCVTYSLDATVSATLRSVSVSADAVTRCLDACPTVGTVLVSGARGTLAWSYQGDGTATVTGSGGATFDVTLACAR